jgi:lambda family phage portal protein
MKVAQKRRKPTQAQIAAAIQNRYDAGGNGPRVKRWAPPASGPQKALQGFERMRDRVHDAVRNDWAARSSTQKWVTNLIGTGIVPRFKVKAHGAIWAKFVKTADADGVLNVYGLQALMGRGLFDGGEVFLRRRPRALTSPLDVPVQIQVIEGEFCPMFDADVWPGLPEGNKIRQGVERNRFGVRTAYWFYREHPGDGAVAPGRDQLIRVAASQVAHVYEVDRPGALRGVSPLSAILLRLREAADLEGVVLDRQKIANLFAMFITRPMPDTDDIDIDPLTGLPKWYDLTNLQPMAGLESGISQELRPGEDVKFAQPPGPGVGFAEYMRSNHLGTSAGQSLPYELMTGDIKDVSDRTLRVIINEFRRYCQQRQWLTLIPMGCQRMLDWCMDAAAMARLLPMSQLEAAKAAAWTPQGWEYIHPTQDAEGKKILLGMGVISKTGIITERGDEPEQVFDEREQDAQEEERRGIKLAADGTLLEDAPDPVAPTAPPARSTEPPPNNQVLALLTEIVNARAPQGPTAVENTVSALVDIVSGMQAQTAALATAMAGLAQQLAARPVNTVVENHVPAQPAPVIQIDNHQAAQEPPVIHNHLPGQEPPVIHNHVPAAPAPAVEVTNVVQPAEVKVELPDRETTSKITRDSDGQIIAVKQTERTIQ